ncbi:MAG TPA: hypothetical protein VG406_14225 [Isosphaeraceae bacterium]|jgi:hypothetical protein|nr:hypothetical protein [Isosphaeraceae bacterium]
MSTLTIVYAADEDLALRASADFAILCPADQTLAAGTDGAFTPDDPWTLRSSSVNFAAQGVAAGQVVQLTRPITAFPPPGEAMVVAAVAAGSVTLRRKGQAAGVGQPPGPSSGLVNVAFTIATLGPQIESASYELNRRFGIDDLIAGRRAADLYDPREIRQATVLAVLARQYLAMSRATGDQGDAFASKARCLASELDDLLARAVVRWGPSPDSPGATAQGTQPYGNLNPPTSRFCTRLSR